MLGTKGDHDNGKASTYSVRRGAGQLTLTAKRG